MHFGRTLLNHIDSEERQRIEAGREFKVPDYRTGDILELTVFQSLSEGKFNTVRGMVIGKSQPNDLRHTLTLQTVIDTVQSTFAMKVFSPKLAKIDVVAYGSNKNRKKLNHIKDQNLTYSKLTQPLKKGRGFKHRSELYQGKTKEKETT